MLVVFAGGMVASALLGEPILGPLKNSPQLLVATICWYIVFYTPFDIGYKVSKFLPVKLVASAMKEIYRAKKVRSGLEKKKFYQKRRKLKIFKASNLKEFQIKSFFSLDPRRCRSRCQTLPKCLHHHDHHWYIERKRCRIHQAPRAIDSRSMDANCNGIHAAKLVSYKNT